MTYIKYKPQQEDRAIESLKDIRWRLVEAIAEIDKRVDYLERAKEMRKEVNK